MIENTHHRPTLIYRRVEGGISSGQKGEEKSNRDNPTFKNRHNPMKPKEKTFSNRDKNTTSASPHFRLKRPAVATRPVPLCFRASFPLIAWPRSGRYDERMPRQAIGPMILALAALTLAGCSKINSPVRASDAAPSV